MEVLGSVAAIRPAAIERPDILIPFFSFHRLVPDGSQPELLTSIFRLRYLVYCQERRFVCEDCCRDGLETDEFDGRSIHFAACNDAMKTIGTVRLVRSDAQHPFPFEGHCSVYPGLALPERDQAFEISRLVVEKSYRRRRNDTPEGVPLSFLTRVRGLFLRPYPRKTRRNGDSPLLLLGLYREMYRYSRQAGIRFWYAAMERSLAKSLEKMGFHFVPVGPPSDYYGPVTPFMVDIDELNRSLEQSSRFLHAWFNDLPISASMVCGAWARFHWQRLRQRL